MIRIIIYPLLILMLNYTIQYSLIEDMLILFNKISITINKTHQKNNKELNNDMLNVIKYPIKNKELISTTNDISQVPQEENPTENEEDMIIDTDMPDINILPKDDPITKIIEEYEVENPISPDEEGGSANENN